MPQISKLFSQRKEKFVKKSYRPWDLTGTGKNYIDKLDNKPSELDNELGNKQERLDNKPNALGNELGNKQERLDNKPSELGNELGNKQERLDNKPNALGNELGNKQERLDNKPNALGNELGNKQERLDNKPSELDNELGNKQERLDNKPNALGNEQERSNILILINSLSGIQKSIFFYILDICKKNRSTQTGHISTKDLAEITHCSYGSVKTSIIRLVKKKLITRQRGKTARNGYINLTMNKNIKKAAIKILDNELGNKTFYISNSNNITITNTSNKGGGNNDGLSTNNAWLKISIDPLKIIGFSDTQLQQLQNLNTPEIVQESIYHFAYGLEHNEKTKKYKDNALNVLMGVLRKGQAWIEPNYRSPQELALEDLISQKKEEQNRCNQKLDELMDLEFPAWHNKLSEQEIEEIVPETFRVTRVPQDVVEYLKKYFRDKMLIPRLKEQGISS